MSTDFVYLSFFSRYAKKIIFGTKLLVSLAGFPFLRAVSCNLLFSLISIRRYSSKINDQGSRESLLLIIRHNSKHFANFSSPNETVGDTNWATLKKRKGKCPDVRSLLFSLI